MIARALSSIVHGAILLAPAIALGRIEAATRPHAFAIVFTLLLLAAIESKAHDRPRDGRWLALASSLALLVTAWAAIANEASSTFAAIGALVAVAGVALRAIALRTLGPRFTSAIEPDPDLVVHGVYGLVRHPSEVGLLLLGLGIAILGENPFSWLAFVGLTVTSATRVAREEAVLANRFGEAHTHYARRTGLLFPRIHS